MKSLFYFFAVAIICISCSKEKDPVIKDEEILANIKKERDCVCHDSITGITLGYVMAANTLAEHNKECGTRNSERITCEVKEVTDDVKQRTCVCRSEGSDDIVTTVVLPADSYSNQESKCESGNSDDIYCEIED